mgnify:CR=1 FL=1
MPTLALFQGFGPWEMAIIAMVGLLLFGKRLPEVGRSLGKGIVEFKRGVKGIEDDIDQETRQPARSPELASEGPKSSAPPKLDPPTGETFSRVDPAESVEQEPSKRD